MKFILTILGLMLALDLGWWLLSRRMMHRWRWMTGLFVAAQALGLLWLIADRIHGFGIPKLVAVAVFLWHLLALPILLVVCLVWLPIWLFAWFLNGLRNRRKEPPPPDNDQISINRREFIGTSAAMLPPMLTLGASGLAMAQLEQFRIRPLRVVIPGLPKDLDGLRIAHVSDSHVGRFTSGPVLRHMAEIVNELRADLVVMTGDLINDSQDFLPDALGWMRSLHGRFGTVMVEGNHDLIEDGRMFRRKARASGVPFLLNESMAVKIRGCPVRILGLGWGGRRDHDAATREALGRALAESDPEAFPILLAHHPHAFDVAAEAGLPLTFSGHTHGGQLMLNERLGFGPVLFRYWSGLYARGGSQLVVSNGIGNWFPIRVHAPAELIEVTLRRG